MFTCNANIMCNININITRFNDKNVFYPLQLLNLNTKHAIEFSLYQRYPSNAIRVYFHISVNRGMCYLPYRRDLLARGPPRPRVNPRPLGDFT